MKLFILILSTFAVIGAGATFGREYAVAYFARSSGLAAFQTLADAATVPKTPLSSRSMRELLMTCGSVQQGVVYEFQPGAAKAKVDSACRTIAKDVLARNPTYSAAHTIVMLSSGDPLERAQATILSQLTAPRESWNVKLRLNESLENHGTGNAALDRALEFDIAFLVQSYTGRAWLADLYQRKSSVRPVIVSVIERRPDDEKAAFLREVRRLGQS